MHGPVVVVEEVASRRGQPQGPGQQGGELATGQLIGGAVKAFPAAHGDASLGYRLDVPLMDAAVVGEPVAGRVRDIRPKSRARPDQGGSRHRDQNQIEPQSRTAGVYGQ